jgi:hypothetical protein
MGMETDMEQDHRNRPPPTPSPPPSGSSGSSSEVVDVEWVEVPTKDSPARAPDRPPVVARVARGRGDSSTSLPRPSRPRRTAVLARARCVVCADPAVSTARLFTIAHVPLCQRCGAVGALALRFLGGA